MTKGCVPCFWMSDHLEFLEAAAVTGSPVEPKFYRMFVLELSLPNFILWRGVHGKPGVLGSAAFPLGFPLPRKKNPTSFVLNFKLAPARTPWDSEHLVEKVLSCLSPVGPQHPEGVIPVVLSAPRRVDSGGSEWGQPKTSVKSRALFC